MGKGGRGGRGGEGREARRERTMCLMGLWWVLKAVMVNILISLQCTFPSPIIRERRKKWM